MTAYTFGTSAHHLPRISGLTVTFSVNERGEFAYQRAHFRVESSVHVYADDVVYTVEFWLNNDNRWADNWTERFWSNGMKRDSFVDVQGQVAADIAPVLAFVNSAACQRMAARKLRREAYLLGVALKQVTLE